MDSVFHGRDNYQPLPTPEPVAMESFVKDPGAVEPRLPAYEDNPSYLYSHGQPVSPPPPPTQVPAYAPPSPFGGTLAPPPTQMQQQQSSVLSIAYHACISHLTIPTECCGCQSTRWRE